MDRRSFTGSVAAGALLSSTALGAGGALAQPRTQPTQPAPTPAPQQLRTRRNVQRMAANDPFFQQYATAVQRMHQLPPNDRRNWRQQALIHLNNCVHGRGDFLHWHRHYLVQFERICAELIGDQSFALAYWDWTANNGRIPDPFYTINFLNVEHWRDQAGASSPNWAEGRRVDTAPRRGLARGRGLTDNAEFGGAFTAEAIDDIMAQRDYALFFSTLENSPHDSGHIIVGSPSAGSDQAGHMGDGMSPLDPIFWLHHCNVDRVWEEWRSNRNVTPQFNQAYNGHFVDARGNPVNVRAAEALDARRLGFQYEGIAVAAAGIGDRVRGALPNLRSLTGFDRIGQAAGATTATVGTAAVAQVTVNNLTGALAQRGAGRNLTNTTPSPSGAPANTPGATRDQGGRVVLHLGNVRLDKDAARVLVNVFINSPSVEPGTPFTDKHFAGTFALFGGTHAHAGHGAGHAAAGKNIVIDATRALRRLIAEGKVPPSGQLQVQLMPVTTDKGKSDARISIGSIEVRRG